jgi:hypothetical protein
VYCKKRGKSKQWVKQSRQLGGEGSGCIGH